MKKIGDYTVRGHIPIPAEDKSPIRIQLFDGRFDTGYRVTKFVIAGTLMGDTNADILSAKLSTNDGASDGGSWNWGDNGEIAWALNSYTLNLNLDLPMADMEFIDRDNMVVQDLYLYTNTFGEGGINYLIELDKYDITDWQGALAMVRNKSQA